MEERRRTGRYIAILVGISLFLLAIYHAWVRRIPIVASLVVPALIMFVYVAWVLFTASRDKHRMLDAEAALNAARLAAENEANTELAQNHIEISVVASRDSSNTNSPKNTRKEWSEISSALRKGDTKLASPRDRPGHFIKPVILINDKPPEDFDQKWNQIVETLTSNDKFKDLKGFQPRRKFKRKFCRRRHTVFKRSYSIG